MKIVKKMSPNKYKGRRGWKPDMIVSHITEGNYAGAVSWLCNPKSNASAHFVVSKKGEITQLVELTDSAWCNGTSTNPNRNTFYGKSKLKKVRDRKTNANYYTISIEHEGFFSKGQGRLTPEQLDATIWLHNYIIKEVKRIYGITIPIDRQHLVGHFEITPITKPNCPGRNFQWGELINGLKPKKEVAKVDKNVPSNWAKEAWKWGIDNKITDGKRPKDTMTREEMVTMLHRYHKDVLKK